MPVLNMDKAKKHQELMREEIAALDFQTMTEWLNDEAWEEIKPHIMEALRKGQGADFGVLLIEVIQFAAAKATEKAVEDWAEDVENEEAGQFRRNARIAQQRNPDGVWLNPVIRGM